MKMCGEFRLFIRVSEGPSKVTDEGQLCTQWHGKRMVGCG
jgi:hypothetical protein